VAAEPHGAGPASRAGDYSRGALRGVQKKRHKKLLEIRFEPSREFSRVFDSGGVRHRQQNRASKIRTRHARVSVIIRVR
jgi:hypothetical protein